MAVMSSECSSRPIGHTSLGSEETLQGGVYTASGILTPVPLSNHNQTNFSIFIQPLTVKETDKNLILYPY